MHPEFWIGTLWMRNFLCNINLKKSQRLKPKAIRLILQVLLFPAFSAIHNSVIIHTQSSTRDYRSKRIRDIIWLLDFFAKASKREGKEIAENYIGFSTHVTKLVTFVGP